jgi:hypothetical protein
MPTVLTNRSGSAQHSSYCAGQLAKGFGDLWSAVRLWQKATARRQVVFTDLEMTRGRHNLDRWPSTSDGRGQLQAVHGSGHLDIGKYDRDVRAIFKDQDSFVGVFRFDDIETCGPNHIDRVHADQELILDDQDDRPLRFGTYQRLILAVVLSGEINVGSIIG